MVVAVGPAGRIAASSAAPSRTISRADAVAASRVSPPTSIISQPAPRGRSGTEAAPFAARTTSTSRASRPSTASGAWASSAGTASAAAAMSGYPSTSSIRAGLIRTSFTVASRMTPRVPSVPTSAFARSRPFSGRRCSSEYPEICRPKVPNSVRISAEMRVDQCVQARNLLRAIGCADASAAAVDDRQRADVVRGAPVGDGVRAAGVVADHPAERRPVLARRVGTEPQTVRPGPRLQGGQHHTGFDERRAAAGVELQHPVQVPGEVDHDAGADRVAGDGRAAAAAGDRRPGRPAELQRGQHVIDVQRLDHHRGHTR